MRILVTNDDGVHAPGLAAITKALAARSAEAGTPPDQVTVVAPLANHSGAGAAVGPFYERPSIPFRTVVIPGAEAVPTFGLDGPPALAAILGSLGAFGPVPDIIVSGINLGVNIGRSILHSGTVGAVLTGAQMGISGLAVSMRSDGEHHYWDTAASVATSLLTALADAPPRTVLNLNVPSIPLHDLRGVRRSHISTAAMIAGTRLEFDGATSALTVADDSAPDAADSGVTAAQERAAVDFSVEEQRGHVVLQLGAAVPVLGDVTGEAPDDDGALIAAGYASVTPLMGIRELRNGEVERAIDASMARAWRS